MSTFQQLRQRAAQRIRDFNNNIVADTTPSATQPAAWSDYINEAYRDIDQSSPFWPWHEVQTTLTFPALTRSQPLPTGDFQVLAAWDLTDQFPLVPLEGRDQYINEYPQQNEQGSPMHYRIFDGNLELYPLPLVQTQVRVDLIQRVTDLSANSDVPVFPSIYHHVIVDGAIARFYEDDGNMQQAQHHWEIFKQGLASMQSDLLQPRQPRYYEVVDTFL